MTDIQLPSVQEIVDRINLRQPNDMFGFEWAEYLVHLPFEHAKSFLKDDAKAEEWEVEPLERDKLIAKMKDYMSFAWEKANDCRGISANRSVMHYIAWTWLAGDRALTEEVERMYANDYHHYGKPILERICEFYGWDWKQWDDGRRTNGDEDD